MTFQPVLIKEIRTNPGTIKPRIVNVHIVGDFGGNKFHGYTEQNALNQSVVMKEDAAGNKVEIFRADPPLGRGDATEIFRSDDKLLVYSTIHDGDWHTQYWLVGVIEGQVVPFPRDSPENDGQGAYIPSGGTEEPVDYGQVRTIVHEEVEAAKEAMQAAIIANMVPKGIAALRDANDPAKRNDSANGASITHYQDEVFTKFNEDMYMALNKQITGENTQLPVANQGFIDLIRRIVQEELHP